MTDDFQITALVDVSRETLERLTNFLAILDHASEKQNLISAATRPDIWRRHIADSLQLVPLAPASESWLDVGTGAGFPGLVIAIAQPERSMTLCEPRGLRADFLEAAAAELGLSHVVVKRCKAERLPTFTYGVISARAVAPLEKLIDGAIRLADENTSWVLPKGRTAREELEAVRRTWQGDFRLVPSLTDPDAAIIVARGLKRRAKR